MSPKPERPRSVHNADGGVVLDIDHGRMFSLNASGSAIFQLLEQQRTDDEIVSELVERFGITGDIARADLADFRRSLRDYSLFMSRESSATE